MSRLFKITMSSIIFGCVFLLGSVAYADEIVNKENIITVGYMENSGMIQNIHITGQEGYIYEYFEELSKYTGHNYEFIELSWDTGHQMLIDGEIDLFGPMGHTEETLETFSFTEVPFGSEEALLTTLKDSDILFDDIDGINNQRVGIIRDSSLLPNLEQYLAENNITVEYEYYAGPNGLLDGKYDLELLSNFFADTDRQIVARLGDTPFYFATQKDNAQLADELTTALVQLINDDIFFEQALYHRYFGTTKAVITSLTAEDNALLAERKENFTVLISADHSPLQYINENGQPRGILIDIMNLIAADGGIGFTYVADTKENPVDYDTIDMSIALLNSELENFNFVETDMFFDLPAMIVGQSLDSIELQGKVGMLDYYSLHIAHPNIVLYDTLEEMIYLLKKGELEYIIATNIGTTYILAEIGIEDYSIYPIKSKILPMTIKLSNELAAYEPVFNKLISRLEYDDLQAAVVKYSSVFLPEANFVGVLLSNPLIVVLMITLIVLAGLIIIIVMNHSKKKALFEMISKDNLTGLISIRKFYETVGKSLLTAKPNEYMLIALDIDNFQYINETYGYEYGSEVLAEFAIQLVDYYDKKSIITREKDDNFLVFTENKDSGLTLCDTCITSAIHNVLGDIYRISVSQGMYQIGDTAKPLVHMIDCAHSAKFLGKQQHGNTVHHFTDEMKKQRVIKKIIVTTMEKALETKEIKVFYQPKVQLNNGTLSGAEALVRWFPADGSSIYPDEFIPLFEKNGFILNLDYYVFEEVCRFIHRWSETLDVPILSVNLSVITLLDDGLVGKLVNIASKYKLVPNQLEIEITESAMVGNPEEVFGKINELRAEGFTISLDDFGSGMSSLNRLKDINIDVLKIDREFLTSNLSDARGLLIIKGVIMLSKRLKILTIAEGVETKEQVAFLQALKCDYAQGYYFGKPMSESDFVNVIRDGITIQ